MGNKVTNMVFYPPKVPNYKPGTDMIWLTTTSNEDICVLFINRNAQYTVIVSHTNAEDLGDNISYYASDKVLMSSVNMCFYDYPGYGYSSGSPTEQGTYESVEAVYLYLRDDCKIDPAKIIAFGRSLGTAAVCHLANRYPLGGIILMSPMLSIFRICFELRWSLPGDIFCNIDKIPSIRCPIHMIHGTEDEIVPFHHSIELYRRSNSRTTFCWVEGGNHNNLDEFPDADFTQQLLGFISSLHIEEQTTFTTASPSLS